jgi:hypothetical protein
MSIPAIQALEASPGAGAFVFLIQLHILTLAGKDRDGEREAPIRKTS